MRVAIIDLGTNTFNLLIAEINQCTFKLIEQKKIVVKLGQGGISENRIIKPAYDRGIAAIKVFQKHILKFNCDEVRAIATSAIRTAENGKAFQAEVLNKFKIRIEIISGSQEAIFIFKGVRQLFPQEKKPYLIMDIGGGSTEFIIASQNEILWKKSYLLGASRLLEKFVSSDPISELQLSNLIDHINETLSELYPACEKHQTSTLIGASGSFSSFTKIQSHWPTDKTNFTILGTIFLRELHDQLLKSSFLERLDMKGLSEARADIIVVASTILQEILSNTGIKEIKRSKYALKEGVISTYYAE